MEKIRKKRGFGPTIKLQKFQNSSRNFAKNPGIKQTAGPNPDEPNGNFDCMLKTKIKKEKIKH